MTPLLLYVNTRGKLDELEHEKGAYYCRKQADAEIAELRRDRDKWRDAYERCASDLLANAQVVKLRGVDDYRKDETNG